MLRRLTIGLLVLVMALALMPAAAFGQSSAAAPKAPRWSRGSLSGSLFGCV